VRRSRDHLGCELTFDDIAEMHASRVHPDRGLRAGREKDEPARQRHRVQQLHFIGHLRRLLLINGWRRERQGR
jgi:hypothetical protein